MKEKMIEARDYFRTAVLSKWSALLAHRDMLSARIGLSHHRVSWIIISALSVLLCILLTALYFRGKAPLFFGGNEGQAYAMVGEKISENAPIVITLPPGVSQDEAMRSIAFDPAIKGEWKATESVSELTYVPEAPLTVGKYYSVNLDTATAHLRDDFLADEDPKISAIFPSEGSEVNENASITVVFNRPMVPLTTLSELEQANIPIKLSPTTKGRWKWISTRNLQFIPETRLTRASSYIVTVGEGFISMDGLAVAPATHHFTTRPLRYVNLSEGTILFNRPISIAFNQPVNLDRTTKEISIKNSATNADIPIIAEYATTKTYNPEKKKDEEFINRAVINIYPKEDRLGRARLWDFNMNYRLTVAKAYPLEGDIVLRRANGTTIQVPDIIASVSATSKRSEQVRPDLFDPEGDFVVTFSEEIDRGRSRISAKGLTGTSYGEKCSEDGDGNIVRLDSGECVKEPDKKTILLHFDPTVLSSRGENVPVSFDSIYNTSGLQINAEKIVKTLKTYPAFSVRETFPKNTASSTGASLTEFVVCSNTPVNPPAEGEYKKVLIASDYMVFAGWEHSVYIQNWSSYYRCRVGEFETKIRYGLLPETKYSLTVKLEDEFSQKATKTAIFTTRAPESKYTRFNNMQKAYNVTSPDKTKLTYSVENLEYVDIHICKMSPEAFLKVTLNPKSSTVMPSSSGCESVKTDKISLPKRYWVNNYFQINLAEYFPDTLGHYIVTFSNPLYREEYGDLRPLYDRTYVSVTRLAVGEKKIQWIADYWADEESRILTGKPTNSGKNLYWVTRFNTLQPLAGAVISTYTSGHLGRDPITLASTLVTDVNGIGQGEVIQESSGAVIKYGVDSAIITPWTDTMQYTSTAENAGKTYLYTDRPIYRPGNEVHFKGIDRVGYDGTYEVFQEKNAKVKVYDSAGTVIYEQDLPISLYGTFGTSVLLKSDAPLGTYRVEAFGNSMWFDVEEYVPSAFKVEVASDKPEYIAGDIIKLDVDAQYYFGVPVAGSEVSYTVTSQDYYFDKYRDEYFNFGSGWYDCYSCGYGDKFLFRGKTTTDQNGKAHVESLIDFSKFYKNESADSSKIFVVDMTVKDSAGRSVSSQKSFVVHRGQFYLGLKTDDYSAPKNKEFTIRGKSVNTEGKPLGVSGISLEINKVTWEVFKRREVDGGFYYRSEQKKKLIKKDTVRTDGGGNWSGGYSLAEEGEYEIKLSAKDSKGNTVVTKTNMYIYGGGTVDVRPTNNNTLEIQTEKLNVSVGDSPKIIIKSPYKKAKALITTERGKIFEYHVVDVDRNLFDYIVPIRAEYAPNVWVSVLLLSPGPEIKFGQLEFMVNAEQYKLNVDVQPDKKSYLPGEKVKLDITTTDYKGKPVSADVSIAVADLSVLALKGNPKKNPLAFFYDGFPLTVMTSSNIKNILEEIAIPIGTKGGGGGADGGLATKKRGIFKDTAFWSGSVITNANGKASTTFTLSDNLTTWQMESIGVTKNTRLGVDYKEIVAQKQLMVVPLKPRFIIPGDEFEIGAKVFNQTDRGDRFDVSIKSATLELIDKAPINIAIDKGGTETVYFKVKAPVGMEEGVHTFVLSAKAPHSTGSGQANEDTVEETIPINPNDTYETVATANFTKAAVAAEYVYVPDGVIMDKGGLTINANATMAVFLGDALKYLVSYPYGCSEQLSSKLSSIATIRRSMNLKNVGDKIKLDDIKFEGKTYTMDEAVKLGTNRLYDSQLPDGSFSYYPGMTGDYYLTLHVTAALENLRKAGFVVNVDSLNRSTGYLYTRITTDHQLNQDKDLVILTAYTLSDIDGVSLGNKNELTRMVTNIAKNKLFLNEQISSMSLAHLAILTARGGYSQSLSHSVFTTLENRIDTDGRGAYLKENQNRQIYRFYETRAADTGLLLKALVAEKYEHPLMDKILRWLLRSRDKDGAWGSTSSTLIVIDAMTDFLGWQKETESDFLLTGTQDDKKIFSFDFNKDTVLDTFTKFVPIGEFPQNKTVTLRFLRENRNVARNNFYYDMSLKYYLPADLIAPRDEGITITRDLYKIADLDEKSPVKNAKVGDVLRGKLTITLPKAYEFVSLEDFIPAGFELVNFDLSTEDQTLLKNDNNGEEIPPVGIATKAEQTASAGIAAGTITIQPTPSFFKKTWLGIKEFFNGPKEAVPEPATNNSTAGDTGMKNLDEVQPATREFHPDQKELHDDRLFLFKDHLAAGVYEYEYYIRALVPGKFQHLPAKMEEMYYPEVFGRTAGEFFNVGE